MVLYRDILFTPARENRRLHIYLPDSYYAESERYPVMYFFDGHNLFFDTDATYGKCWGLKDFLDRWGKKMIVVGLECGHAPGQRLGEYSPYSCDWGFMKGIQGTGESTFRWMVEELKPLIDREYRTLPQRSCTGIAGSSMGGLMAWYGAVRYNRVFSKAACVSSAIGFCMGDVAREMASHPLDPDTRVYLSWGSREAGQPARTKREDYENPASRNNRWVGYALELQGAAVEICCQIGGNHCEADWEKQVPGFMDFLWMR